MISMVILLIGMLGLLQAINVSMEMNVKNEMRTQAASIAEDQMARKKSLPFDDITPGALENLTVPISMRSSVVNYSVTYFAELFPAGATNTKRLNIGVRWSYKGNNYEHVVSSLVTRPDT
jgi:type IV pilus assembly protein PilV